MEKDDFKTTLTSNVKLKFFLKENGLYLKKRFGQNFLFDRNVILKIVNLLSLEKKNVIEIGAGIGNVTLFYYQLPEKIFLIEIDKGLKNIIQKLFQNNNHVSIIHADFLKYDLNKIIISGQKYIIVSNLPYNAASQILIKLLDYYDHIKTLYIMAPEIYNTKFISLEQKFDNKLGVLLNLFFKIENLFHVSKNCFFPVPQIDSVFLKLTPHGKIEDIERSKKLLTVLFKQKRRKLKKILERSENAVILNKFYNKRIDELKLPEIIYILRNFGCLIKA